MRLLGTARLAVSVLLVLAFAPAAGAQVQLDGLTLQGEVLAGYRYYLVEPPPSRRAKFEEYRDLPQSLFLGDLRLRLFRPDESYSTEFGGTKWGQRDQEFFLGAGRLGLWQFGFEWDQIPHIYSTTGRTSATEVQRGVWTLPTPRPLLPTYNDDGGFPGHEISQRWDTARLFFDLTPTPDLDIHAEYTRIHKSGDRPFGVAFGSPGNNFFEIVTPIEQTVQDFRLRATFARERWQLQAGYTFSMFNNGEKSLTVDNPCFGLTASLAAGGCAGDATGAPRTGLVSLDPDNMAHTFSLGGGVSLPMRSRITANFTYSLRLQDQSFLPHTVNPAITSPLLTLPQRSLDGMVGTTLFNFNGSTRPLPPLTITLRYRYYDYDDMSDEITFPAHVVNDRTLVIEERLAGQWSYTRQNAELDGRWRFGQPVALTLGGGWERWDRNEHWEVPKSDELFAKAALDVTPVDWLLARLTYRPSFRRIDKYNTFAHATHTVVEEQTPSDLAQGQSTLLRKFDEGERDTQSVQLMLQVTPAETLTASVYGEWRNDDYIDSVFGLQDATRWSAGFDASWRPSDYFTVFGGYVHELIFQKQRSRSRPVTGTTTFDFPDFDWISVNTDTVDTFHLGTTVTFIPGVLRWNTTASYAYALGRVETRNPGPLTSGTAAQRDTARAKPFPAFEDALLRLDSVLQYRFWKNWTASVGYAWESFEKHDWRTDTLNPFVPGVTSIWLGNDLRNYSAHILTVALGYRF